MCAPSGWCSDFRTFEKYFPIRSFQMPQCHFWRPQAPATITCSLEFDWLYWNWNGWVTQDLDISITCKNINSPQRNLESWLAQSGDIRPIRLSQDHRSSSPVFACKDSKSIPELHTSDSNWNSVFEEVSWFVQIRTTWFCFDRQLDCWWFAKGKFIEFYFLMSFRV